MSMSCCETTAPKININVRGLCGSGKSTVMALIQKSLVNAGFPEGQVHTRYNHEDDHSRPIDVRLEAISTRGTQVTIQEIPQYASFEESVEYTAGVIREGAENMMPDIMRILEEHCSSLCLDSEEDRAKAAEVLSIWVAASINSGVKLGLGL
jgi:hypothetical protein